MKNELVSFDSNEEAIEFFNKSTIGRNGGKNKIRKFRTGKEFDGKKFEGRMRTNKRDFLSL